MRNTLEWHHGMRFVQLDRLFKTQYFLILTFFSPWCLQITPVTNNGAGDQTVDKQKSLESPLCNVLTLSSSVFCYA